MAGQRRAGQVGGAQLCRAGCAAHVEVEWEDEGKVSMIYRELYVGSKQGNTQLAAHYNRQQAVETDTSVHSWRILAHPYTNFLCLLTSLFTLPSHFTYYPPPPLPLYFTQCVCSSHLSLAAGYAIGSVQVVNLLTGHLYREVSVHTCPVG